MEGGGGRRRRSDASNGGATSNGGAAPVSNGGTTSTGEATSNGGTGEVSTRPNIADVLFGKIEEPGKSDTSYFSDIFPSATKVMERHKDWQRRHGIIPESDDFYSIHKEKEGESIFSNELIEPTYFTSSIHYGGREYYVSPNAPKETPRSTTHYYMGNGEDDPNYANRGDWWLGSLYY